MAELQVGDRVQAEGEIYTVIPTIATYDMLAGEVLAHRYSDGELFTLRVNPVGFAEWSHFHDRTRVIIKAHNGDVCRTNVTGAGVLLLEGETLIPAL